MKRANKVAHERERERESRRALVSLGATVLMVAGVLFVGGFGGCLVSAVQNIFTGFGQITDIQFEGSNIDMVVYRGEVLWEREAPMVQAGDDIQTVTAANCPTARTMVRDARDGATYWIRKIPDTKVLGGTGDLCWMETNLAYAGGGDNAYGDVAPAIKRGLAQADSIWTEARYFIPNGSNRTTGTTNPSVSTNGVGQYGYLYNWCAAMASQSDACSALNATYDQPNQSVNPGSGIVYNICPVGWRLPIGGPGGEFASLNGSLNGGIGTSDSGMRTNGLYMYTGQWLGSAFTGAGSQGRYWSSLVYSGNSNAAYTLFLSSSNANPTGSNSRNDGLAVRCVAD